MVSTYDRSLLMVAVGVVLLLNPAYLYPHGGPQRVTYEFQADRADGLGELDADVWDVDDSAVLRCTGTIHRRACLLERQLGANGTLTVTNATLYRDEQDRIRLSTGYRYVHLRSGFYEPRVNESNGSVVLRLARVNRTTVVRDLATEYEYAPPVIQHAVDNGSAAVTISVSDLTPRTVRRQELRYAAPAIVKKGDSYYAVRQVRYTSRRFFLAKHLTLIRMVAVFAGGLLIFWAFQRPGE